MNRRLEDEYVAFNGLADIRLRFWPAEGPLLAPGTFGIAPGDEVTFKVRTFGTTAGEETWDFGDGGSSARTRSDGNVDSHAENGYAIVTHRYARPGHYLVRVARADDQGRRAVGHLQVRVGGE